MRILITNDDGIDAEGLGVLADLAVETGHEVVVAAPDREYSGFSAGLACSEDDDGLIVRNCRLTTPSGEIEAHAVHASPALIAYAAGLGVFGPRPDFVLSGINRGANVGAAVVHSGTVGAALAAAMQGIPSLATSSSARKVEYWETHRAAIRPALEWLLNRVHDGRVLNVNVPDVPLEQLRGIKAAGLAPIDLSSLSGIRVIREPIFEALADLTLMPMMGRDADLLRTGWATLSLLRPPSHDLSDIELPSWCEVDAAPAQPSQ